MTFKRFVAAVLATLSCVSVAAVSFAQSPKPMPSPSGKMSKPAKKMPPRDSKGRFIKASPSPAPMVGKKGGMAGGKMTKKMPPRDSKGRFIKASPSPAAPKPK